MDILRKYLMSSAAVFDTPNEGDKGGAAVAKPDPKQQAKSERENIKVESTNENDDKEEKDEKEDDKEDDDEGDKGEEGDEKEEPEKEANDDDPEKLKKTIARLQRRLGKETGSKKELQRELKEAKDALAAKDADGDKMSKEDAQRLARQMADQDLTQKEFNSACNRLADAAEKVDKDFQKKVDALNEDLGPIPGDMIGVLDELDNGGAVLAHLANDVEKAEEIFKLTPARRAIRLAKLSDEVRPKPKKVSQVPPPTTEVGSGRGSSKPNIHDPNIAAKMSDSDWIEQRNREVMEKRRDGTRPNIR